MPTKQVWIVLDPMGELLWFSTKADKSDAILHTHVTGNVARMRWFNWKHMQEEGYRCVRARLEWEEPNAED